MTTTNIFAIITESFKNVNKQIFNLEMIESFSEVNNRIIINFLNNENVIAVINLIDSYGEEIVYKEVDFHNKNTFAY